MLKQPTTWPQIVNAAYKLGLRATRRKECGRWVVTFSAVDNPSYKYEAISLPSAADVVMGAYLREVHLSGGRRAKLKGGA